MQLPGGSWYGPLLGPLNLTLPGNMTLTRLRTQTIPAVAPAGSYWYEGRIGNYSNTIADTSGFSFTKLGSWDWGLGASEWENTGNPFPDEALSTEALIPSSWFLLTCFPNPFNATTILSFELRVPSVVKLEVVDIHGRCVGTGLAPVQLYPAGIHQIPFDGAHLPSGLIFAKLTAGEQTAVQKLILLK